jgi:hypothetical protein
MKKRKNPGKAFLKAVQQRTARVAISASACRGGGSAGVVQAARDATADLDLGRFATRDRAAFARALDAATKKLLRALPRRARAWGLARKLLNIFLRDSLYTGYLRDAHGLQRAERFFEIPLDSITAARLHDLAPKLPRWAGVRCLDPSTSAEYQSVALLAARKKDLARVHLDAFWWGARAASGVRGLDAARRPNA